MANRSDLTDCAGVHPGGALLDRVPRADEYGRPLSDFMMLIPGLRDWPGERRQAALARLHGVLAAFREVVFADVNLPLNLLWVSVRAKPGIILDLAVAIQAHVPEARLVGHHQ